VKIKVLFYLKNGFRVSTQKMGLEDFGEKDKDGKYTYTSEKGETITFESISDLILMLSNMIESLIKSDNPNETISFGTLVVVASEISAYKFKVIKNHVPAPEDLVTVEYQ
jgi:hypothetical protein